MIRPYLRQVVRNDEGVTAVEYSIMAALVAGVLIVAFKALTGDMTAAFGTIGSDISGG